MPRPRVLLVNPKTVNKYYHCRLGRMEGLFVRFFRWFYDRRFDLPTGAL